MNETIAPPSRVEFFDSFASDPAAAGFIAFLFGRSVEAPNEHDFSNAHTASLAVFAAIQLGDEALFQKVYSELSRRRPRDDTPWLFNDPLIYGLVLGAVKFDCDTSWLQDILWFRIEHSKGEPRDIASTLSDILSMNWGNSANLQPLVLVAQHLLGLKATKPGLLDSVYRVVTESPFPYHESIFLNVVYIRAFDVVVLSKAPLAPRKVQALERLVGTVWEWSRICGQVVWLVGLIGIFVALVGLLLWVKSLGDGSAKQWIEVLSLVGMPVVAVVPAWPWVSKRRYIISKVQNWVAERFFGLDTKVISPSWKNY